jgi:membrane protein involved in colicin uptake
MEARRKMLADIDTYFGEGSIENLKPASSIRSSRVSRASGSRSSARSKEEKIQEKAQKFAETELMMKQAQEEARLREIEEERIRRLEEDKRKEKLKVEVDGARPVTPVNAH